VIEVRAQPGIRLDVIPRCRERSPIQPGEVAETTALRS
jgi:hypothetical protein